MKVNGVLLPLTTTIDGRAYELHVVEFDSPDGKFLTYMYATSEEHARLLVQDAKDSLKYIGTVKGAFGI